MWLHATKIGVYSLALLWLAMLPEAVLGSPFKLLRRATPCDEILDIVDAYGTLEGTLGGAQIMLGISGSEAGTVVRQFMTFLDSATLNVYALFDAVPGCKRPQAPSWEDGIVDKRQGSTAICTSLSKVTADVAQAGSLMSRLSQARGLPSQLYLDPLQEAVDDAKAKIVVVGDALKTSNGC